MTTENLSRRSALMGGATALAGVAAALAVTTKPNEADAQVAGDVAALNLVLTEEYKLINAYGTINDVLMTPPTGDMGAALAPTLLAITTHLRTQHRAQAAAIAAAVTAAAGTPTDEGSVSFMQPTGFTRSVTNVLKLAVNLERTTAIAYVNATKNLSSASSKIAASVSSVHTQNFLILYLIAKGIANGTMATAMNPSGLSPQSFTVSVGGSTTGLEVVPDFTFGPLNP